MYVISACLAGVNCKYNGGNNYSEKIAELVRRGKAVLVCPEQLGGLPTPRVPAETKVDREGNIYVLDKEGKDVTPAFVRGAEETLKIAKQVGATAAILKARSPSCGRGVVYDGTFSGRLAEGNGITAELLIKNGIKVFTEEELGKIEVEDE